MSKCNCKDWEENIGKIDDAFVFIAVHSGNTCSGYDGKKISHCPWCGKKLTKDIK